jgi:hypothetical protein
MPVNRLVALATPVVAALLVKLIPDPAVAYTAAAALVACALSWLQGWKQFERFEQDLELVLAGHGEPPVDGELPGPAVGETGVGGELPPIASLTPAARAALAEELGARPGGQL